MMDQNKNSGSSPDKKDSPKAQDNNTVVLSNKKAQSLECGHSTKNVGMWNIKHENNSRKFYELLLKTEVKGDTDMDLKNFYKHINICLNAVTRLQEYILPTHQSIKKKPEFAEYFISDCDHPSYSWNRQT